MALSRKVERGFVREAGPFKCLWEDVETFLEALWDCSLKGT